MRAGIPFDLTLRGLLSIYAAQRGMCAMSGAIMTWQRSAAGPNDYNISIDRIDPAGPYSMRNVQLTCKVFNFMRHTHTISEFIVLCHRVANRWPL